MSVRVHRSCVIEASIAVVWRLLRDFNSHAAWHPSVAASRIEAGEPGDRIGAVRAFRLADGGALREQLIALSDRTFTLTYGLLEAPLPLNGYVATMRLRPVTDRDVTLLTWESRFHAPPREAAALARLVSETIYEAGMRALQDRFGGRHAADRRPDMPQPVLPQRLAPIATISPAGIAAGALEALAVVVDRHGGPEVLTPRRIRVDPPGFGDVRLRHRAIGVNMIDVHGRAGEFGLADLPAVPGLEAAGEVLDIGPGVTSLRPGDRVVYACPPPGAYVETRTMAAALLHPLPADIVSEDAAAVFLKGLMVDALVHDIHRVEPGQTVLVQAAAGGLGLLLCAWTRHLGASVIGVVSSPAKAEAAARAGCHEVVVTERADLDPAVRRFTSGRGADVVYDGVGRATFDGSVAALARRGHLVSFGQASGPVGSRSIDALASRSARLSRPNLAHFIEDADERRRRAERLFQALRQGAVRSVIDRRFPLAEAAEAHRRLETRQNIGSVILVP